MEKTQKKQVTVKTLKVLKEPKKKDIPVGTTMQMDESKANILKSKGAVDIVPETKK